MEFGLILPHFGQFAGADRVCAMARAAERAGFHSLWVRDHLIYHPHGYEDQHPAFLEPFTTLAVAATVAPSLTVGTAVAIPVRHPLAVAQSFLALSQYARGKVVAGIGAGRSASEFAAVGYPFEQRVKLLQEFGDILRLAFSGEGFGFEGQFFRFQDARFTPSPRASIPILVGGLAPAAIRLAARFDGWIPARVTFATFADRLRQIRDARERMGREPPIAGAITLVSVGDTRDDGRRALSIPALLDRANRSRYMVAPSGRRFERFEDLEGSVLAGSPDDIRAGVERFRALGAHFLVLDLRLRFAEWDASLARLAEILQLSRRDAQCTDGAPGSA